MNTWLITGGCGFIGSRLVHQLLSNTQDNMILLDNFSVGTPKDLALPDTQTSIVNGSDLLAGSTEESNRRCQVVQGDIGDIHLLRALAERANRVIHLAANTGVGPSIEDPVADCTSNVIGTLNVLEAARQKTDTRVVFASSGAPLGEVEEPPIHEELPAHPVSPYGASKLAGEGYCSAYFHSFGVKTVALRFGNVYGPGSLHKGSVVAKFIKAALAGKPLQINGDGSQTRDFIYIDDLINAIMAAASIDNISGQVFQIATNRESTVIELSDKLVDCLAKQGITSVERFYSDPLVGDVQRNFSDISKAARMLGWQPNVTLEEGLTRTVQYFLKASEN